MTSLPALVRSPSDVDLTAVLAEDVRFHSPAADYEAAKTWRTS